jgi:hypothetical protein
MTTFAHRIAADSRYLLLSFPLAIISFCLIVTGVAAGVGSMVTFIGLPILAATALVARNLADLERAALPGVLDTPVERPDYTEAPASAGWFRRVMNPLTSGQAVMDLLHAIIAFPVAVAGFVVTVTWWAGAIAGLASPLYVWFLADHVTFRGLPSLLGLGDGPVLVVVFNTAVGLLFAVTALPVLRGVALTKAAVAQALLTRPSYPPRRTMSTYTPASDLF